MLSCVRRRLNGGKSQIRDRSKTANHWDTPYFLVYTHSSWWECGRVTWDFIAEGPGTQINICFRRRWRQVLTGGSQGPGAWVSQHCRPILLTLHPDSLIDKHLPPVPRCTASIELLAWAVLKHACLHVCCHIPYGVDTFELNTIKTGEELMKNVVVTWIFWISSSCVSLSRLHISASRHFPWTFPALHCSASILSPLRHN